MNYLSRAAPLQSSARMNSYSRRILPSQVHLKSIHPRQHFPPRFITQWPQRQAEEAGLGGHRGVTQNILEGSSSRAWDMALSNRCDSSCQGFGPHHHHHHSTSTLWVTRTLHLFFLVKIKSSHSHVQPVLMIGQYGNEVIERWGYSSSHRH